MGTAAGRDQSAVQAPKRPSAHGPSTASTASPTRLDIASRLVTPQPLVPDRPGAVLGLQRLIGNTQVARLIAVNPPIQRYATVRDGSRGGTVRLLQQRLNAATPAPSPALKVDGIFGEQTATAVTAFQKHHGLKADAVAGKRTWAALTGTAGTSTAPPPVSAQSPTPTVPSVGAPAKTLPAAPTSSKPAAEPALGSTGPIANAVGTVVEKVLDIAAEQPGAGGLPPSFVEQQLTAAFQEFTAVPVVVRGTADHPVVPPRTVQVHTPYLINVDDDSAAKSKEVVPATAMAARQQKAVRAFFANVKKDDKLSGQNDRALVGKATPQQIQGILQAALDQAIIQPQDAEQPTAADLRPWLRTHGVGVDCSGFVSQALTRVVEQGYHASGQQGPVKEIYHGSKGLKGGTGNFAEVGKNKTCKGPTCLAAGDTMYIPGHIRIIASVTPRDGGVEFSTYESYAGGDERTGLAVAQWFYPKAEEFSGLELKGGRTSPGRNRKKNRFTAA